MPSWPWLQSPSHPCVHYHTHPCTHQRNCCHVRQRLLITSFLPADPFLRDKSPHRRPYLRSPPDTRHLPRSSSLRDASDSHRSLPLLSLHLSHPPRGPLASLTFKPAPPSIPLQNLAGARAACSPSLHDFLTPQRSFPPAQASPAHSLPLLDRGLTKPHFLSVSSQAMSSSASI